MPPQVSPAARGAASAAAEHEQSEFAADVEASDQRGALKTGNELVTKRNIVIRFCSWCRPRTTTGWSTACSLVVTFGIPLWFILSQWHNPHYDPVRPWVWFVPSFAALLVHIVQSTMLMMSANQTEKTGLKDILLALAAFISAIVCTVGVVLLWIVGLYHLGPFQWSVIASILLSTYGTFSICGGTKWFLNRRTIAAVNN